ncbi:MAG: SEL1-like repeat protein [Nitrospirae bacterium]|nr:SEL1-like repeat protein [Magnetococcales bacterium]
MKPLYGNFNKSHAFLLVFLCIVVAFQASAQDDEFEKYRKAAESGDFQAQAKLGMMYANGDGVRRNDKEAVKWFFSAAYHQMDADAQAMLGIMYENGRGVPQSYSEAALWYTRAANQQHPKAHEALGRYNIRKAQIEMFYTENRNNVSELEIEMERIEWDKLSKEEQIKRNKQREQDEEQRRKYEEQIKKERVDLEAKDKNISQVQGRVANAMRTQGIRECPDEKACKRIFDNIKVFIHYYSDMTSRQESDTIISTFPPVEIGKIGMDATLTRNEDGSANIRLIVLCKGYNLRELTIVLTCGDKMIDIYSKFHTGKF